MKRFIRKKLPFILIAVQVVLIAGLLLYIVPGRYRLYDIVLYDAAENVPENPLMGYAPRAELKEDCADTDLVFIMLPFSEWEPQEGVFDIAGVSEKYHIDEYRNSGKHAVLRFVCDIPSQEAHRDIPQWLCDQSRGVDYDDGSGKGYAPDYGDAAFLKAHREALEALASWCAQDSFVSYVEMGSVGQNGDWNLTAESAAGLAPTAELLTQYAAQYKEAFSNDSDLLLLSSMRTDGGADAGSWKDVLGDKQASGKWTADMMIFADGTQTQGAGPAAKRNAADKASADRITASGAIWAKYPVGGGLTETVPMDKLLMDNLSDTLDQVRSSHVSFIGPVCPDDRQQQSNGSEMIRRNMGYCLYLSRLQTTVDFVSDLLQLHFTFNNIGAAPMYRDWPVKMYVYQGKNLICEQTLDLRLSELMPGAEITVTGTVPYSRDLLKGYTVGIAITSPDNTETITLAQKGVLPNADGIHKVYRFKKMQ